MPFPSPASSSMERKSLRKQDDEIQSHDSSTQSLPLLFELLHDQKWEKVRSCLQLSPSSSSSRSCSLVEVQSPALLQLPLRRHLGIKRKKDRQRTKKGIPSPLLLCQQRDHTHLSCLAFALGCDAPLDIIQGMVKIEPSLPNLSDDYHATALHVACLNGAQLKAINFIISKKVSLLRQLDVDHRSVLHQAVEHACEDIIINPSFHDGSTINSSSFFSSTISGVQPKDSNRTTKKKPSLFVRYSKRSRSAITTKSETKRQQEDVEDQSKTSSSSSSNNHVKVIERLCEVAPEMVHVQDKEGKTPTDLVQLVKIGIDSEESPEEYEQLERIYEILRDTSIRLYKKNRRQWEQEVPRG